MLLSDLKIEITTILKALRVPCVKPEDDNYSLQYLQYEIPKFGVLVCGVKALDYTMARDLIEKQYVDWRIVYMTPSDNLLEKKEELIWKLMRSGYMTWIRETYPRQFKALIVFQEFGKKIINNRLKIWDDKQKYTYLINRNKEVKDISAQYILTQDTSFFDMMPE